MAKVMQRPDIGFNRSISLPSAWRTADLQFIEAMAEKKTADGHTLLLSSGTLQDGTVVWILLYPGGARLARSNPDNDWAVEEATRGRDPWERHRTDVDEMWAIVMEAARHGLERASAVERDLPDDALLAQVLDSSLKALTGTARVVADTIAGGGDPASQAERWRLALVEVLKLGATREQVCDAIAKAKANRGGGQVAVLDFLIGVVNDAPEPGGES